MTYRLLLVSFLIFVAACGGSSVQAGPAYTTAVRVARAFCSAVALLPEPTPPTAGGEATP